MVSVIRNLVTNRRMPAPHGVNRAPDADDSMVSRRRTPPFRSDYVVRALVPTSAGPPGPAPYFFNKNLGGHLREYPQTVKTRPPPTRTSWDTVYASGLARVTVPSTKTVAFTACSPT